MKLLQTPTDAVCRTLYKYNMHTASDLAIVLSTSVYQLITSNTVDTPCSLIRTHTVPPVDRTKHAVLKLRSSQCLQNPFHFVTL